MPHVNIIYVKNIMRRGISELLDLSPTVKEVKQLKAFFQNKCVYCGRELLAEKSGEAHIDHLVAASVDGKNGPSNRVLACRRCNVEEKRELAWEPFLHSKCPNEEVFAQRHQRILDWQAQSISLDTPVRTDQLIAAMDAATKTIAQFEIDCQEIENIIRRQKAI